MGNKQFTKGQLTALSILKAAAECIATIGIESTSISAIADKAKVSRGLVAHYFPEKKRLFRHVIEAIAQEAYTSIESPPTGSSAEERIFHTFKANMDFFFENPTFFSCFMLLYYFSSIQKDFRKFNQKLVERPVNRLAQDITAILEKRGRVYNYGDALEHAESFHRELISAIEKYYVTVHQEKAQQYQDRFLNYMRKRIEAL